MMSDREGVVGVSGGKRQSENANGVQALVLLYVVCQQLQILDFVFLS